MTVLSSSSLEPQIKGASLIQIVKNLRKNREAARALVPEALHRYLEERLLPTRWYPEADYKPLLLALGEMLRPIVPGDVWEFIGEQGAQHDFQGMYASVVRPAQPQGALRRVDDIWHLYRDSGHFEIDPSGEGEFRVRLRDYPLACPEICGTVTGYIRQLLVLSGASDVRVEMIVAPPAQLGPCEWRVRLGANA